MIKLEDIIYKFITNKDIKIPLRRQQVLMNLRELDTESLGDDMLIRRYYSKRVRDILISLIASIAIVSLGSFKGEYIIFSIVILVVATLSADREINNRVRDRREAIMMEFPSFINKVILLVESGSTIVSAWSLACDSTRESYLNIEALRVKEKMDNGYSFTKALEEFAVACRVNEVSKFTGLLIQSYKKGNKGLAEILRIQGSEIWQVRKDIILRITGRANTKLLFPMIIVFISTIMLVLTPALLQLKGIG